MKSLKIIFAIFFICLSVCGCTIIVLELFSDVFDRVEGDDLLRAWTAGYPREEVHFYSSWGGSSSKLQGFVYGNDNDKGLVVILHGLQSYADEYEIAISFFVDNGWRVFAYNNTGVDGSEGNSMRGLSQGVIDLKAALDYINSKSAFNDLPVMLAGYSLGGFSACAVLNYDYRINAVASFAAFNSTQEVSEYQVVSEIGGIYYLLTPQVWALERQIFGDIAKLTAIDGINKAQIPVLIIHCSSDDVIPANSVSVYSHRSRITNPYTEIIFLDGDDIFGHFFKRYPRLGLYEQVNLFFENAR
ncbi:MAG: lysophospholipase [Treponema sp.]|nr:lysophospholipase [Treponema sp.]